MVRPTLPHHPIGACAAMPPVESGNAFKIRPVLNIMANRARLFKKSFGGLVELREDAFDKERSLHDTIERNIGVLFPGLEVLDREFERDGYRFDTVAFDKNRNTFAIIEYKNRLDPQVLIQSSAYLTHMNRNKDSFSVLYHKKFGVADTPEFNWNDAYAIIMSPAFMRKDIDFAQPATSLTLYEVSVYEDIISMTQVAGSEKKFESTIRIADAVPASEPTSMDQLYQTIKARLLEEFHGAEMNEKPKYYNGLRYPGKRYFCTIWVKKRKIWMSYLDKAAVSIENEAGFERALADMRGLVTNTPDDGANVQNGMDRLYSDVRAKLLSTFPGIVKKKMKLYERFEVDGQLLCTMGRQKSKIWFNYARCTANPAPDQPDFVQYDKAPGWGLGHWRSEIRGLADFDRALSILKDLYGNK